MSDFADGVAEYLIYANVIMPYGYHKGPLDMQRNMYDNYAVMLPCDEFPEVIRKDIFVADVPCRKFYIKDDSRATIVYFHGGGFVLGGKNSHSDLAEEICQKTMTPVILVDYRLAPENKFPAALNDSYGVVKAILSQGEDVILAGEGSGGNIACYVARRVLSEDLNSAINRIALFCPVLNFDRWRNGGVDVPGLSGGEMTHFVSCYTEGVISPDHIDISPLLHANAFKKFPKTYIAYASEDSLNVDAIELSNTLTKHSVKNQLVCHQGLVHACLRAKCFSEIVCGVFEEFCEAMIS